MSNMITSPTIPDRHSQITERKSISTYLVDFLCLQQTLQVEHISAALLRAGCGGVEDTNLPLSSERDLRKDSDAEDATRHMVSTKSHVDLKKEFRSEVCCHICNLRERYSYWHTSYSPAFSGRYLHWYTPFAPLVISGSTPAFAGPMTFTSNLSLVSAGVSTVKGALLPATPSTKPGPVGSQLLSTHCDIKLGSLFKSYHRP